MYRNCAMKSYKEIRSVVCTLHYLPAICSSVSCSACKKTGKNMNHIDKISFERNFSIISGSDFSKKKNFCKISHLSLSYYSCIFLKKILLSAFHHAYTKLASNILVWPSHYIYAIYSLERRRRACWNFQVATVLIY